MPTCSSPTSLSGYATHWVHRQCPDHPSRVERDQLAVEVPIVFEYNGVSHATVLATPYDMEDFARGFSLTEGIVRSLDDIYAIDCSERDQGVVLQISIASACLHGLRVRRRNLAGRTGCGLCGVERLEDVQRNLPALPKRHGFLHADSIAAALARMDAQQPLRKRTGATHAAAWSTLEGEVTFVREDVGRHNAVDKVVGALHHAGLDPAQGFIVVSSRASFEIVQKAAAAGVSAVVAVSAPTSFAVSMATELNVMLVGFARGAGFTIYAHPSYLVTA